MADQKERVMYLDVDDTLLVWTSEHRGHPAPRAYEFVQWALEHFEVRWLTMWCPAGWMEPQRAAELSRLFDLRWSAEEIMAVKNPKQFVDWKTEAVDFDDPRPWVWVEDAVHEYEKLHLQKRGMYDRFYKTNVSHNRVMLQVTWNRLAEKFDLPKTLYPYTTDMHVPDALKQDDLKVNAMIQNLYNSNVIK